MAPAKKEVSYAQTASSQQPEVPSHFSLLGQSAHDKAFDDIEQVLEGKGFGQEGIGPQFGAGGFIGRIGGHGDEFDVRISTLDKLEQVKSAFARQVDFRQEQMNRTAGFQIGLQAVAVFEGQDFAVDAVHHDVDDEVAGELLMIDNSDFDVRYDSVPSCDFKNFGIPQLETIGKVFADLLDVVGHGFFTEASRGFFPGK
jgi:hypothetical protein